jgi:hypothetical protein
MAALLLGSRTSSSVAEDAVELGPVLAKAEAKGRGSGLLRNLASEGLGVGRDPELGIVRGPHDEAGQGSDQAWMEAGLGFVEAQQRWWPWAQQRRAQAQEAQLSVRQLSGR